MSDAGRDAPLPWHALSADEVLRALGVDPERGLVEPDWRRRQWAHGPNSLPESPPPPGWHRWLLQFRSPLILILFVAAALAIGLGQRGDAAVILVVVLVNACVGAAQEGRAERSMAALRRLSQLQVRVLRDGQEQTVQARELVPGDLLLLSAGDAIGADARLVEASALHLAEAALTGESVPVPKAVAALPEATGLADRHDMVFAGTHVTAGRGRAVVVATGAGTEVGRIAELAEHAREPQTPLQARVERFGRTLVLAAVGLFVLVLLLGTWRGLPLAEVLLVAIGQMVSMVPEGLPVAMTIALAVGMQRMAARGAIVRRLAAVETLGSTNVICTDKTGTLTRNEMTATTLWLPDGREVQVEGSGYAPHGALRVDGRPVDARDPGLAGLLQAGVLCNDAELLPPEDERGAWSVLGDPTEAALLVLAAKAGLDPAGMRRQVPRGAEWPFDSGSQLMATRHALPAAPQRVLVKGAPEAVLRLCGGAGRARLAAAQEAADAMAARALRVLALAEVDDDALDAPPDATRLTGRARLLGLAGLIDPPREEARAAVAECRAAGIRVVMLTGDHKLTGLAIARELGIAGAEHGAGAMRAVDGPELERMGEAELRAELDHIAVYARVQPAQKLRIVEALQARGAVVAMTGDGVNDAPALARADVGVAMGLTGTEVAKSAARIVVTDDNFATIVGAVEQGRVVHGNLKKVILFLFATSIDEVAVLLLALLAGFPLPLAAVQILWINLVTEGTLTINLVMDPPDGDEMHRPPLPRDDPLVGRALLLRVLVMSSAAVVATFGWFAWRLHAGVPLELVRTESFTVLAMCQWFNVLNCRSATRSVLAFGRQRNHWLAGGLALSVALQAAAIYLPAMNTLLHTVAVPPVDLLPLAAVASLVLWVEELRKWIARRRARAAAAAR